MNHKRSIVVALATAGFLVIDARIERGFGEAGSPTLAVSLSGAPAFAKRKGAGGAKNKVINGLKKFANKLLAPVKKILDGILNKIVETVASKLSLSIDELQSLVGEGGKLNHAAVKRILIDRITAWAMPWIENKVRFLVEKALTVIRPLLNGVVSAIIGAIGSIPFVGGVLAAAVSVGYRIGLNFLIDAGIKAISGLAKKAMSALLAKGYDALVGRIKPLQRLLDKIAKQAQKLFAYMSAAKEPAPQEGSAPQGQRAAPPSRTFDEAAQEGTAGGGR